VNKNITIIALTDAGYTLANKLGDVLKTSGKTVNISFKPAPFTEHVQQLFTQGHALIFITAMGIAVRSLAAVIKNKQQDPPVLVMDEQGKFIVPLLSGHEGGANQWAKELADAINAQAVITTCKTYAVPVYTVGMGCERGCSVEHLSDFLAQCLEQAGLTMDDVASINSIDVKADEDGLITLADLKARPYQTYSAKQLSVVEKQLSTKSDYVHSVVGVYGVAESAALVAAQENTGQVAELLLVKQKTDKATCAIARSYKEQEN